MPSKPMRPCGSPRCPNLIETGTSYCPAHSRESHRRVNANRNPANEANRPRNWAAIRKAVLLEQPLCAHCLEGGRLTAARDLHHIVPLAAGGSNDRSNLLGLCQACHSRITATEGGGFGH